MALTNANLFSESFNAVKAFLVAKVPDPRSRFKVNWLHASMPLVTKTERQFLGFKNIPQLRRHVKRELPNCEVKNIRRGKTLQPSVKGGRTATSHFVTFKKRCN